MSSSSTEEVGGNSHFFGVHSLHLLVLWFSEDSMSCRNCAGQGGVMVRDSGGEGSFDPCNECDAWSKSVKAQRQCDAARAALRMEGLDVIVSRRQVIIMVEGVRLACTPLGHAEWAIHQAGFIAAPIYNKIVAVLASS